MKNITDQAVTMRSHCDKIDIFLAREPDDLVRRFAEREHRVAGKTFAGQFAAALFQVSAIVLHLFAFGELEDRKSTRLNSSHRTISYAVFCLKKKNKLQR